MSPEEFIAKWRGNTRSERAAAQQHFLDLCGLLGVDKPGGPDYDFEKSTRKIGDTQGFADGRGGVVATPRTQPRTRLAKPINALPIGRKAH
jgi:hypothetical protein